MQMQLFSLILFILINISTQYIILYENNSIRYQINDLILKKGNNVLISLNDICKLNVKKIHISNNYKMVYIKLTNNKKYNYHINKDSDIIFISHYINFINK